MDDKIKVLHTEWSDGWGGQEIRIINEMLSVRDLGVEVFLACKENAKISAEAKKHDIKTFHLPFRGNADIKTFMALRKIIKEHGIDIVNTHSGKDTWIGGICAKMCGAKFIRTRHLANPINPSRTNFINELADFVITTGERVKDAMIKNNRIKKEKIASIPTGADESMFDPKIFNKNLCKKELELKDNELAIGALGVIRRVKRHIDFIHAAKILSQKYDNLKFFIAGDGPIVKDIKEAIQKEGLEKTFFLLGHTNEPAKYLSSLDIFINSSESEGVPQAVIQALMMKLPIVATDVGSTKDLFFEDNFILAKPLSPEDLADKIEILIKDESLRKSYTDKSRDYAVENFSKKAMGNKVYDVYRKVLGS